MLEPLTGTNYYIRMGRICQHFLIKILKKLFLPAVSLDGKDRAGVQRGAVR